MSTPQEENGKNKKAIIIFSLAIIGVLLLYIGYQACKTPNKPPVDESPSQEGQTATEQKKIAEINKAWGQILDDMIAVLGLWIVGVALVAHKCCGVTPAKCGFLILGAVPALAITFKFLAERAEVDIEKKYRKQP